MKKYIFIPSLLISLYFLFSFYFVLFRSWKCFPVLIYLVHLIYLISSHPPSYPHDISANLCTNAVEPPLGLSISVCSFPHPHSVYTFVLSRMLYPHLILCHLICTLQFGNTELRVVWHIIQTKCIGYRAPSTSCIEKYRCLNPEHIGLISPGLPSTHV